MLGKTMWEIICLGKLVLYFRDSSVYYPNVMVLEVSGDTVTFGTTVVVNSGNYGGFCTPVYNPNYTNKAILFGKIYTTDNNKDETKTHD